MRFWVVFRSERAVSTIFPPYIMPNGTYERIKKNNYDTLPLENTLLQAWFLFQIFLKRGTVTTPRHILKYLYSPKLGLPTLCVNLALFSAIYQAEAVLGGRMAILSALGVTLPPAVSGDLRIRPVSYLNATLPFASPHPFTEETMCGQESLKKVQKNGQK